MKFIFNSNVFKFNSFFNYYKINNLFFFNLLEQINFFFLFFFLSLSWLKVRILYYINNWVYTTNHRRIAVNYFWFVILSGIVGMVLATVIRLEFAYPGVGIFAGDSLQYLSLVSAHGVIMVFFMIMPLLFGAFANFLLPTQLGVHDVAFPRLNSAAFWFLPAGLIMLAQLVCIDRRYQRMNCFNIREIQSILKKRFFNDLINNKDFHDLTNYTMMGLRFKTNNLNTINTNSFLFYNYGIDLTMKSKSVDFSNYNFNFFKKIEIITTHIFNNIYNNFNFNFFSNFELIKFEFFFLKKLINLITNLTLFINFNFINFNFINFLQIEYNISINFCIYYYYYKIHNKQNFFLLNNFNNYIDDLYYKNYSNFYTNIINDDLTYFNKNNFNSYYIYIYIFFNLILDLPFYIFNFLINIFNFKQLSIIFFNFNNFLMIWFVPLVIDDNIFFIIWKNIYNLMLFKFNLNFFNYFYWFNYLNFINFYQTIFFVNPYFINFNNYSYIITTFFKKIDFFINTILNLFYNINFNLFYVILNSFYNFQNIINRDTFTKYKSNTFLNLSTKDSFIYLNEELGNDIKIQKFDNPIFKYDYKSGDYFPKLYKEVYSHLFSSIIDLTGGLRQAPWFLSNTYSEIFINDFNLFNNYINKKQLYQLNSIKFNNTISFYNLFYNLNLETIFVNKRWIFLNGLNQKFYKMFNTSSMQQRIYSNWRQLKFTREAWRCKLLAARHQKTLYKRFLNEDGVFWSIERNAKDLLPGWAMITPFSSRTRFTAVGKVDIGLMGVLLVLNSSIISGANFLVTYRYLSTLNNRKMRDARSFFTEGIMVSSWMMILANPMLVIGIIMLLSDRHWQTSFFDYSGGGDTVLFQHMFWFFGHPEVYIIIIPTFGFTNTILSFYLRKRISARASLMYSMYTIAFLGFFVWGHHMYMVGLAHTTRMLFSTLTVMISVPAATKLMHWCVTFVNSSFTMELPLICTLTFVFMFVSGGISGMCVAHTGMDVLFHDTFYVIGHFHVMLAGGAMISSFGAFYFYFVSIFGVKFSRLFAYLNYFYYLLGQLLTVIPMIWLGYSGMPRRVLDYPASMGGWHSVISGGHMLSVAGLIAFFIMIFDSLRQAKSVVRNTFGISRYNTRLNFYIYEISRLIYFQQKAWNLISYNTQFNIKNTKNLLINLEHFETTIFFYKFIKK